MTSRRWQLGALASFSCAASGQKRKGVRFLDMNALPSSDGEGECSVEWQDSRNTHGNDCFGGSSICVPVESPNLRAGSTFSFHKVRGKTGTVKISFEDVLHHTQTFSRCFQEVDLGFPLEKLLSYSNAAPKLPPRSPNDVSLKVLKEFISERHDMLEEGWHVEFRQHINSCELYAVFCAPNGMTFKSMSEVAGYLELMSDGKSLDPELRIDGSAALQKRLALAKRRKSARLPHGFSENKENLISGVGNKKLSPGIQYMENCGCGFENDPKVAEYSAENNCDTEHQHQPFDDGFPVQFEDFYVFSLGRVDVRPSYHDAHTIWPVGYKSCWHDNITGSLFTSEVLDGGDSGPLFRVSRCSCSARAIPIGSTVIFMPKPSQSDDQKKESDYIGCDEDDSNINILLSDPSSPKENDISLCLGSSFDLTCDSHMSDSFQFELSGHERSGSAQCDALEFGEQVGEFSVEGQSSSSVWQMVSQKLIASFQDIYKRTGTVKLFCKHMGFMEERVNASINSLARFCNSSCSVDISMILNDSGLGTLSEELGKWLDQDRFGLDVEFVQEFIEQILGADLCSFYKCLSKRHCNSTPITVGNGLLFFKAKNGGQCDQKAFKSLFRGCISSKLHVGINSFVDDRCLPPGKHLGTNLAPEIVGNVIQVWELLCRFLDVLGLKEPLSYEELEKELISPWLDGFHVSEKLGREVQEVYDRNSHGSDGTIVGTPISNRECGTDNSQENPNIFIHMETGEMKEAAKVRRASATYSRCTGVALTKVHVVLLKVLISELQSKVAALVDPNFDVGDLKARRGRKKDLDNLYTAKKMKLNMLPINELTWPELARRYILAFLAMDGNLDSAEITARECGKVFRCLQGDGGVICGSLTGVAGIEADALLLAEAMKRIYGPLNTGKNVLCIEENESDVTGACEMTLVTDDSIPEWAQLLEPVKKLPTNVGARIRKCVHDALEKGPPEWAKKILEHSISKEVYKGNASGPTKKAVISVLADVYEGHEKKPDKERKRKIFVPVSDIIMKQCRIVLRRAAAADDEKVFCNLLGRNLMNSSDNDDEGLLGSSAMLSRPLDFRTIDIRLAVGAYGGSHEAFLEDVRELWNNVRRAYGDQLDFIELAESLSQNFESTYEREVVTLVEKLVEYAKLDCYSAEVKREIDDLLVSSNEIPKAPWDEGVCKVCGIDKDDDSVLLCDTCDAEYHTYCLNPPLVRIPEGNWYCPSCVAGIRLVPDSSGNTNISGKCLGKKYQADVLRDYHEELTNLAAIMEEKEYWEFSVDERSLLLKFLCDELLSTALVRQHLEQCAEMAAELQQKLRSISAEWKNLKFRENFLAARSAKRGCTFPNAFGEVKTEEGLASSFGNDSNGLNNHVNTFSDNFHQPDGGQGGLGDFDLPTFRSINISEKDSTCNSDHLRPINTDGHLKDGYAVVEDDQLPVISSDMASQVTDQPCGVNDLTILDLPHQDTNGTGKEICFQADTQESGGKNSSLSISDMKIMFLPSDTRNPPIDINFVGHTTLNTVTESQAYSIELNSVRNDISQLHDSTTDIESQLLKLPVRREFLGSDSAGRLYWVSAKPGMYPSVIVDSTAAQKQNRKPNDCKSTQRSSISGTSTFHCLKNRWPASRLSQTTDGFVDCTTWVAYDSDAEIRDLIEWLKCGEPKDRELKEAIMHWQKLRFRDSQYCGNQDCSEPPNASTESVNIEDAVSSSCLVTTASTFLEKRFGPFIEHESADILKKRGKRQKLAHEAKLYRCECLELIWPSRPHCLFCHRTFTNDVEFEGHADGRCTSSLPASEKRMENSDLSRGKGINKCEATRDVCADEMNIVEASRRDCSEFNSRLIRFQVEGLVCPFNFKEISSKFMTTDCNMELVKGIGLIASDGTPSFIQCSSPFLQDSTIMLISPDKDVDSPVGECEIAKKVVFSQVNRIRVDACHENKFDVSSRSATNDVCKIPTTGRSLLRCLEQNDPKSSPSFLLSGIGIGNFCMVPESSLRPLCGKVSRILRRLKIHLLDMDAALPDEALKPSRAHVRQRWAWRDFVKSAQTIFEMIQATIVMEDMIKAEYLKNGWWYWSSLSAAAKTSTLSSLALRVHSLDAAIIYDKLSPYSVPDQSNNVIGKLNQAQPGGFSTPERSKLGRRPSKRRKDSEG